MCSCLLKCCAFPHVYTPRRSGAAKTNVWQLRTLASSYNSKLIRNNNQLESFLAPLLAENPHMVGGGTPDSKGMP